LKKLEDKNSTDKTSKTSEKGEK